MSFIFAGIVFVGTCVACFIMVLAASMSDSPEAAANVPVRSTAVTGTIIALLIAASHWLPHIGW